MPSIRRENISPIRALYCPEAILADEAMLRGQDVLRQSGTNEFKEINRGPKDDELKEEGLFRTDESEAGEADINEEGEDEGIA